MKIIINKDWNNTLKENLKTAGIDETVAGVNWENKIDDELRKNTAVISMVKEWNKHNPESELFVVEIPDTSHWMVIKNNSLGNEDLYFSKNEILNEHKENISKK